MRSTLPSKSCYVIAEAGSCHMGSKDAAFRLIQAASHAGADACKFQLFRLEDILIDASKGDRRTELPPEWVPDLAAMCREYHIDFLCTPFAPWAVEVLNPHVWAFKVGSFEAKNETLWDAVQATEKPIIASWGRHEPLPREDYLIYCVSEYPADPNNIYLLRDFKKPGWDGFSDHTTSTVIPAFAVARGARIIEKHLRLPETTSDCPDFPHSLEPWQFAEMVKNIRLAEVTCWRQPPESTELSRYPNRRESV